NTGADPGLSGDGASEEDTNSQVINITAIADHLIVVDTTNDAADGDTSSIDALLGNKGADGFVSLREAIIAANNTANGGALDEIRFNIAGIGVRTISPLAALPTITAGVVIDGLTQPGASTGTLVSGTQHTLLIELSGTSASGIIEAGLDVRADDTVIRGLIINNWTGQVTTDGIQVLNADNVTIEANYVGTNAAGTAAAANQQAGIVLESTTNSIVQNNLSSGNSADGIVIRVAASTGNVIQGNLVGTNAAGNAALGNSINGIAITNGASGNTIGGRSGGEGNTIAFNGESGVVVISTSANNSIVGNSIHGNTALGIDIGDNGVDTNDADDSDFGPNDLQNYPVLTAAIGQTGNLIIQGSVNSLPSSTFVVDFYWNSTSDPSGHGEGQNYIGSASFVTDATGLVNFTESLTGVSIATGAAVTATATNNAGSTSEFGPNVIAHNRPTLDLDADNSSGASGNDYSSHFVEDAGPVWITDLDVAIFDDSGNLQSIQVTLTNPTDGADEIIFTDVTGTAITSNFAGNILTLSGSDSVANYRQVLRSVAYVNLSDTPDTSSRVIEVVANNGFVDSTTARTTISLAAANDSPVAVADTYVVLQNTELVVSTAIGILANDSDTDSANLTVVVLVAPMAGPLALNSDGSFNYRPDPLFFGTDSFTYQVTDGTDSATETVTIVVDQINASGGGSNGGGSTGDGTDLGDPGGGGNPIAIELPDEIIEDKETTDEDDTIALPEDELNNRDEDTGGEIGNKDESATGGRRGSTGSDRRGDDRDRDYYEFIENDESGPKTRVGYVDSTSPIRHTNPKDPLNQYSKSSFVTQTQNAQWKKDATTLLQELDEIQAQVAVDIEQISFTTQAVTTASVVLTVGYTAWTLHAGYLAAAMFSSIPVWTSVDPLPILADASALGQLADEEHDESLATLIDGGQPGQEV
ncbi:MAG: parallel beta-helix repeat protein, partial [Pirellulaceae bacterium]